MNLLIINLDKAIFEKDSSSLARLKEYSRLVDKIFVIVWTKKKLKPIFYKNNLFIYPTNSCCRLFYFFDSFKLAFKILKQNSVDVMFTQDPFETGLAGWLISKFKKIPLQLQIHTDVFSFFFWKESFVNKIRVVLAKFLIPRAQSLRVVSKRIKDSVVSKLKFTDSKIFVLPILVNAKKLQTTSMTVDLHKKYPQFDFIFLMVARLSIEKNIKLAIESISRVCCKHKKVGLVIVGSGEQKKKLKSLVATSGLSDNIKFEGWKNNIISYYKTSDAFLLTSNYEGYGLSAVEALIAGCPVVMTDVGTAGEVIVDEQNGLVVPVGDLNELTKALIRILEDSKLRKVLKSRGIKSIENIFNSKQYFEIYKESWLHTKN